MNEFVALRAKAAARRDRLVAAAWSEYADTLARIAGLERDLLGKKASEDCTVAACVRSVLPADRTFTTVDIMAALAALDPARVWRKSAVDNCLARMRDRGTLRRLKRSRGHEPAVYARTDIDVGEVPFEGMTLVDVATLQLVERPMTQTELTVAMLEAGYETKMTPQDLRRNIGRALKRHPDKFKRDKGVWRVTIGV